MGRPTATPHRRRPEGRPPPPPPRRQGAREGTDARGAIARHGCAATRRELRGRAQVSRVSAWMYRRMFAFRWVAHKGVAISIAIALRPSASFYTLLHPSTSVHTLIGHPHRPRRWVAIPIPIPIPYPLLPIPISPLPSPPHEDGSPSPSPSPRGTMARARPSSSPSWSSSTSRLRWGHIREGRPQTKRPSGQETVQIRQDALQSG